MAYPGDSAIDAQPVGEQSGQGSPYAALYDQAYANPGAGTGTDSAMSGNQSFAPDQSVAGLLPQYEELPADYAAMQPGATLPADASAAQLGSNPWDTYVMNSAAIAGQPDATQAEGLSPEGGSQEAGLLAAASPEEQVAQLQQHLESTIKEVEQLGTSGQMTGTEEDMQKFSAALTELVATAEMLGSLTGAGDPAQAGQDEKQHGQEVIDPEAMTADGSAMQPEPMVGNAAGEQLQVNPYEPQVPATSTDGTEPQMAMAPTGSSDAEMLQEKLGGQISQLVSFITPAAPDPASPAGTSTNSGNADNFKMALKNIVQTARELGASQSAQVPQPESVG